MAKHKTQISNIIKNQFNQVLKQYLIQENITYEELAISTNIDIGTIKKIDKEERLTFYYIYVILNELGLWFDIKLIKR